jgi:predicted Fe-Mo cluster-binding NifX family protein
MKIAVAALDANTVSPHFGRSACFIVFEEKEGKIVGREVRDNTYTPHAKGECSGEHDHDHQHDHSHGHAGILSALHDCDIVLCRGMGGRAAEDLKTKGIRALIVAEDASPEEIVKSLLAGTLNVSASFCRCHE